MVVFLLGAFQVIKAFHELDTRYLRNYWRDATNGVHPLPWMTPPLINIPGHGVYDVRAMVVTTATGRAYSLDSYREFFRLMDRDGYLRLVHETSSRDEIILQAFGTYIHELPKGAEDGSNVIPLFKGARSY